MRKSIITIIMIVGAVCLLSSCAHRFPLQDPLTLQRENLHVTESLAYPDSLINPLIEDAVNNQAHYVAVLNNGNDALLTLVHCIRQAQRSILIQTFIWDVDETGRFVAYELIQAAKRGVKIKIIVDYFLLPQNPELIAFFTTAHPNIELKLYNPISNRVVSSKLAYIRKASFNFRSLNQRMHNKLLIIDDRIAFTGGRNYQNDYYDRGVDRNFKDRDVLIISPVVNEMTESFTDYWGYRLSVSSRDMVDVRTLIKSGAYKKYSTKESFALGSLFEDVEKRLSDIESLRRELNQSIFRVDGLRFIADQPGKNGSLGQHNETRATYELNQFIQQARESVVMQTPYLVVNGKGTEVFKKLVRDKPGMEILVSSNSLASADHIHAYAFSYKNKKKYLKKFNWQIFELKPLPEDLDKMIDPLYKDRRGPSHYVCIHAKSYVVDHDKVLIGSFNLDPRSAYLNTEVGVIIENEAVARAVEADIRRDMAPGNSWTIGKRPEIPVVSHFSGLLSNIIGLIPIVDLWPFTYSGSFELREGEIAVPFFHKEFYRRYRYLGPFPEVALTEKEIKARLIKAFLGPVESFI